MKQLLIAGIPGTGKTTMGNYLQEHHNFVHIDLEEPRRLSVNFLGMLKTMAAEKAVETFCNLIKKQNKDVVITWGFCPDIPHHVAVIRTILACGATMVWFDGDRQAAHQAFAKRATRTEETYQDQMQRINSADIIGKFHPIAINTFNKKGHFLPKNIIAKRLLSL